MAKICPRINAQLASRALWANAEKLQLVIEVAEAGFEPDFIFQLVDGAGGLNRLDTSTSGADEIITVSSWHKQGKIRGPFVKSQTADQSMFVQSLKQAENRGFVALVCQSFGSSQFGKRHWASTFQKGGDQFLQGLGTAQACQATAVNGALDDLIHSWVRTS